MPPRARCVLHQGCRRSLKKSVTLPRSSELTQIQIGPRNVGATGDGRSRWRSLLIDSFANSRRNQAQELDGRDGMLDTDSVEQSARDADKLTVSNSVESVWAKVRSDDVEFSNGVPLSVLPYDLDTALFLVQGTKTAICYEQCT